MVKNNNKQSEKEQETPKTLTKILNLSDEIQALDDYFNGLSEMQSKVDEELSDLLHFIENNKLNKKQSENMINLLKEKRHERRELNNDFELKKTYNNVKNKLVIDTQRQFFLHEIHKRAKELNCPYKNRRITDEEILNLIK